MQKNIIDLSRLFKTMVFSFILLLGFLASIQAQTQDDIPLERLDDPGPDIELADDISNAVSEVRAAIVAATAATVVVTSSASH